MTHTLCDGITACPYTVVLGDTCDNALIAPLCLEADVIVHEATNEDGMEEQAVANGHSTPGELHILSFEGQSF